MSGSKTVPAIAVFARSHKVGDLRFPGAQQCQFSYADDWCEKGFPISPHLTFSKAQKGEVESATVVNFLRNLFPEGSAFENLLASQHISRNNLYAILSAIGHDTAGALTFGEPSRARHEPELREVTEKELVERLQQRKDMSLWDGKFRLSVAGVQSKLNVYIKDKKLFLAEGDYASTHILKFAPKDHPTLVQNEHFCMQLAHAVGLDVAQTDLLPLGDYTALLVERFDRRALAKGVAKRHIIDGCQALDMPPEYKYEQNFGSGRDVRHIRDGVSLARLFAFADKTSVPALTRQKLLDWVLFNLIVGNSDAHGKNVSFFIAADGSLSLTPFYDLVSVVYEGESVERLDTDLAMAIGDNFSVNSVTAFDLLSFADENGIKFDLLERRLLRLLDLTEKYCRSATDAKDASEATQKIAAHVVQRCAAIWEQAAQLEEVARSAF